MKNPIAFGERGLGGYWDSRLWQEPSAAPQLGGKPRQPKALKLDPLLGIQYCNDSRWRITRPLQHDPIALSEAARRLHVSEADLTEWPRTVDRARAAQKPPVGTRSPQPSRKNVKVKGRRSRVIRSVRPSPQPARRGAHPTHMRAWLDKVAPPPPHNEDGWSELERKGPCWHSGGE